MLIENISVPRDRRVWPECLTLKRAGYDVTVVCPQGSTSERARFEQREGIKIYRYPAATSGAGQLGYLREYALAFWHIRGLVRRLSRQGHIAVVHAGNPPDFLLLTALSLKRKGTRFVFDHHDLVPELYRVRFGSNRSALYWIAKALERLTFRLADIVITTNESYRRVAIERGGMRTEDVFVVRNGPDPERFRNNGVKPDGLRGRTSHLIAYVGVMGPQDGVDHALHALALLRKYRADWRAVFVGDGDAYPAMRELATHLGLDDVVEFTGALERLEDVPRILTTADVCVAPEPSNALNDVSTMVKIAEYMAMERPIVCYDLPESRFTAGEAAVYAEPNNPTDLARCIAELLDDPARRAVMGRAGRARVEQELAWTHSEKVLLSAYRHVIGKVSLPHNGAHA
jgi:glycosyltransferase involved in cell wall biosynthesis